MGWLAGGRCGRSGRASAARWLALDGGRGRWAPLHGKLLQRRLWASTGGVLVLILADAHYYSGVQ